MDMKLAGLVFLGMIISVVLWWATLTFLLRNIGEGRGMLLSFLVIGPLSFLIGSIITGYFSYYDIEDKWSLLAIVPALYVYLLSIGAAFMGSLLHGFIKNDWSIRNFFYDYQGLFLMGLLWTVASAAGVFLGYFLRDRLVKWWYRN
jgi:hypothetical protein